MSNYNCVIKIKNTGEIVKAIACDDYWGKHEYGYKISDGTVYHQDDVKEVKEKQLCSTCKTNTLDKCKHGNESSKCVICWAKNTTPKPDNKVKPECPICKTKDLTDGNYCLEDGIFIKPEGVGEWVERIVIEYANLSGRESANRAEFRKRVEAIVSNLLLQEKAKWKGEIENTQIDKAHTYASENAEDYRIYDAGQENYKKKILSLIDKL